MDMIHKDSGTIYVLGKNIEEDLQRQNRILESFWMSHHSRICDSRPDEQYHEKYL